MTHDDTTAQLKKQTSKRKRREQVSEDQQLLADERFEQTSLREVMLSKKPLAALDTPLVRSGPKSKSESKEN